MLHRTPLRGSRSCFSSLDTRPWNASRDAKEITVGSIEKDVEIAKEELASRIYDATFAELSKGNLEFLPAMNKDSKTTARNEITQRTGRSSN